MIIAIIGIRNHAERMARLVSKNQLVDKLLLFHPDKKKLKAVVSLDNNLQYELSSDFESVMASDAVIIASPHSSHFEYILRLLESNAYILCEKPPASDIAQLDRLASLSFEQKSRIAFNFNYAFSDFAIVSREIINNGNMGQVLALNFTASHGLAFKPSYANNWRLTKDDPFSTILGNLAIHYVHMTLDLIGPINGWHLMRWAASQQTNGVDTVALSLDAGNNVAVQMFLSYAAPYTNSARLMLTDGLVCMANGVVTKAEPRDSFDEQGRFKEPPQTICSYAESSLEYYDKAIIASVNRFVDAAWQKLAFNPNEFSNAINAARIILEMDRNSMNMNHLSA